LSLVLPFSFPLSRHFLLLKVIYVKKLFSLYAVYMRGCRYKTAQTTLW